MKISLKKSFNVFFVGSLVLLVLVISVSYYLFKGQIEKQFKSEAEEKTELIAQIVKKQLLISDYHQIRRIVKTLEKNRKFASIRIYNSFGETIVSYDIVDALSSKNIFVTNAEIFNDFTSSRHKLGEISVKYSYVHLTQLFNRYFYVVGVVIVVSYLCLLGFFKLFSRSILGYLDELKFLFGKLLNGELVSIESFNYFKEFANITSFLRKTSLKFKSMREKERELFQSAAIGRTTAMLAHDVRKPFSIVKSVLDTFDEFQKEPLALNKAKVDIEKSIKHVETMISDIMDFSREVKLEVAPESIVKIIDFSIRQIAQNFKNADIVFTYNINHSRIPLVDDERMARVFSNIVGNGIEAIFVLGKKDSGKISISTSDSNLGENGSLEVTIGNDGPPFSEEDFSKLFESFFTKGKKRGTGLGLASAHKIVSLHAGTISARNMLDKNGVEFVINLPTSDQFENAESAMLPHSIKEAVFVEIEKDETEIEKVISELAEKGCKYKVLLLEDEALYRASVRNTINGNEMLSQMLTLYEVQTVDDGMKLLGSESITHAIVDIDLGNTQSGFDFLQEVRERYSTLECMVHSNRCIEEDKDKSRKLGAKGFVPKPMNIEHLVMFLSGVQVDSEKSVVSSAKMIAEKVHKVQGEPLATSQVKKVLVLNDDDSLLISFKIMLKSFGIQALLATNVSDAMKHLLENKVDMILSDINLGEKNMNGYEFLKKVREKNESVPFYFVSGYTKSDEEPKARAAGATGYIQVPVNEAELRAVLQ